MSDLSWTDARVELLKKLWQDGLSATQIAKQLGGCSRNAVIGKVHRLGLSGRAAPSKPARTIYKAPRPTGPVTATPSAPRRFAELPTLAAAQPSPVRYVEEVPGSATLLSLGAGMCKWPIGDPALEGFTLCGRQQLRGSYCAEHAAIAYQPAETKKKGGARELARSLRRYI